MAIAIAAGNASEWTGPSGNTTFLFPAAPAALIDAGIGREEHLDAVERALAGAPLQLLLITHGHVDHVAGIPSIQRRWPSVTIRSADGRPLRDGELFDCGGTRLRALHTPGHAPDHFCFHDEPTGQIYTGDLIRAGGTVVIPASRGGDLRQYLTSLRRIRDLQPSRLFPAHGPAIDDPQAAIDAYLKHREERHQQIANLLHQGASDVDELVSRIYPDLSPRLVDAARETVRAHLAALDR